MAGTVACLSFCYSLSILYDTLKATDCKSLNHEIMWLMSKEQLTLNSPRQQESLTDCIKSVNVRQMNGKWMDSRESDGEAESLGCSPTIHDLCNLKKMANLSDLFFSTFITIRNM